MSLLSSATGVAAVAVIYIIFEGYRDYVRHQWRKRRVLSERVAHLVWCAAHARS
jgi:hypothetical protein